MSNTINSKIFIFNNQSESYSSVFQEALDFIKSKTNKRKHSQLEENLSLWDKVTFIDKQGKWNEVSIQDADHAAEYSKDGQRIITL